MLGTVTVNTSAPTHLLALSTAPSADVGRAIVKTLVERRLIACGTVLDSATSIYRWKGAIEDTHEAVLLLKTTSERWRELAEVFPSLHPYDVPELIAVPLAAGLGPYLDWLSAET